MSISDTGWVVECDPVEIVRELEPGDRFRDCEVAPEMIVIPAGSYMMGAPDTEATSLPTQVPRHEVRIGKPFAVGVYEVTFDEWDACARTGGCGGKIPSDIGQGRGRNPVFNVNHRELQPYLDWLSEKTGRRYRLPSEAEWEYVARAGVADNRLPVEEGDLCKHANLFDKTLVWTFRTLGTRFGETPVPCFDRHLIVASVGTFRPNAFGVYDMLGNVAEWTEDCYHPDHESAPGDGNPRKFPGCEHFVSRGGSWFHGMRALPLSFRSSRHVTSEYSSLGFRVARDLD